MTRITPELAPPSPNFHVTPTGGQLATTYDLACNRPHTRRILMESGFEPGTLRPKAETLPLGHSGPKKGHIGNCNPVSSQQRSTVKKLVWCRNLEMGYRLKRHLTAVQNDEVRPKIALE
ncbi:hypothetical protein AVEN_30393-1 [Araneus ventricosus]|uniref:Uncharacterized protein n=1 Tax=Araneus ventricosus TaxID=182803 RepID=A0A4Y2C4R9_ARAVE|nr:hypothetical protein AVEN_30393-1 [Araneus ventricosus]